MPIALPRAQVLPTGEAATYAEWFACLAEPVRVRLLHAVATTPKGITIGALTEILGTSQSTTSHHVRKLADVGFVRLHKEGTATIVTVNEACCAGLPHAADAVMGLLAPRPCCPADLPDDVTVRALEPRDWTEVRRIYGEGIATGIATFETAVPTRAHLDKHWLPAHRWVAEIDGQVVGWTAASPASGRECYSGVAETSVYVADSHRGRGVGKALLHKQVLAADDDGLWTLQTSIFTDNRASLALHHSAGYRTVGVRERIAQRDGIWHDTILLERRSPVR
ncbi:GNAT family N-acetyltransferase [Nocardia farcinica]|uniref:helix-turn-helix domain-containing GNAT family N-acetyltransferase n=1 Tax=Nocardia farcinica TaxID=37329 RepID=UPI001893C413|nr:GNAT family N-acetyltransferase [Nocardia farcinica]MBF6253931.1 GNAT family N-acetyltransferase [Nocardia farcinica]MBF6265468.1 GNAT family N-acetyltransferase [Nocardia farcinica]MBF6284068.1 GNAT family N-acetyltransferase [Nocardia farcinica]MBF6308101.1 GNAT family N-acetyltransferase [Nocardia farcinica]MBF6511653.1 GNAT family N-acetyltransferase [Nocardia farcinica]